MDYRLLCHVRDLGWYEEFKYFYATRIIDILDGVINPGLKAEVTTSFMSTPLTIERTTGNSDGPNRLCLHQSIHAGGAQHAQSGKLRTHIP